LTKRWDQTFLPTVALVPSFCEQQKSKCPWNKTRKWHTAARAFHEIIVVNSLRLHARHHHIIIRRRWSLFHLFAFSSFRHSDCQKPWNNVCRSLLWSGTNEAAGGQHGPREIAYTVQKYGYWRGRGSFMLLLWKRIGRRRRAVVLVSIRIARRVRKSGACSGDDDGVGSL
jgi:hypothetical protein